MGWKCGLGLFIASNTSLRMSGSCTVASCISGGNVQVGRESENCPKQVTNCRCFCGSFSAVLPVELNVVIPLIEVEIPAVELNLTALKISRLGTKRLLGRNERRAVIEIDDQAIRILMAKVKLA